VRDSLRPNLRKVKEPTDSEEDNEDNNDDGLEAINEEIEPGPGANTYLLPIKASQIASNYSREQFIKLAIEDEEENPLLNVFGVDKDLINFYIATKVERTREFDVSGKEKVADEEEVKTLDRESIAAAVNRSNIQLNLRPKTASIEKMLLSGPDLYSNMFDVIIAWNPKYPLGEEDYLKNSPPAALNIKEKILLSQACLITRFASIDIPTPVKNTFVTSYQMRSIERVASNVNYSRKSQFTIDADENLFVLDLMQNLSGHMGKLEPFDISDSAVNTLKSTASQAGVQLMNNNIGFLREMSKMSPWEGREGQNRRWQGLSDQESIPGQGLCIIVRERFLSDYLYKNGIVAVNTDREPYWIFENIRILGTSDSIRFNRDDASKHTFTVGFIFRRCYRLDESL
jgi:hypothetical protein